MVILRDRDFNGEIFNIPELKENLYFPDPRTVAREDRKAKLEVNPKGVANVILDRYRMVTLIDSGEMFCYEDGAYVRGAEALVQNACEMMLGEGASNHIVKEVLGHVQRSTPFDRALALDGTKHLCLSNGILDVLSGEWRDHTPDDVFFMHMPVTYNPQATCPRIDGFISQVFAEPDRELAYEMIAYTLVPGYPIQKAFALVGSGNNGKSTFLGLVRAFLGAGNISTNSLQDLDENRFSASALYRKKANICADLSSRELHRTAMFKALTGGDRVRAEFKHVDAFEFENSAKLFFSMNQVPLSVDDTEAFYRRWILIDFPFRFEGSNLNLNKLAEITTGPEFSGLLNKCLELIPKILERKGFTNMETTDAVRQKYVRMSDSVYCFAEEQLEALPGAWVSKRELYARYLEWCRSTRVPAVKERKFKARLLENIPSVAEGRQRDEEGHKVHVWEDVRLKGADEIAEDEKARQSEMGDFP
ncbi:MAG: phage/plasmid primase, P4 family [Methanomassiliicoccales archaeon]|nr:phage/plasmid primase, P4 family [Methanomassiliicoccales archaeon]